MKKLLVLLVAVVALAIPAAAIAANPAGISYDTLYGVAAPNAQCGTAGGSGSFAAFGNFGEYGHDFRGGANGYQTGLNNSGVCGSRP